MPRVGHCAHLNLCVVNRRLDACAPPVRICRLVMRPAAVGLGDEPHLRASVVLCLPLVSDAGACGPCDPLAEV
uniref:Uncharacterized protein n=1 Tax=uncultured marine virus TaxID=186617 RepID=A0A0F7LAB8_9VIRU|nr:hypothetical protein [uncultured marine virus]